MVSGEFPKGEEGLTIPELTLTKGATQAFVRPKGRYFSNIMAYFSTQVYIHKVCVLALPPSPPRKRAKNEKFNFMLNSACNV